MQAAEGIEAVPGPWGEVVTVIGAVASALGLSTAIKRWFERRQDRQEERENEERDELRHLRYENRQLLAYSYQAYQACVSNGVEIPPPPPVSAMMNLP